TRAARWAPSPLPMPPPRCAISASMSWRAGAIPGPLRWSPMKGLSSRTAISSFRTSRAWAWISVLMGAAMMAPALAQSNGSYQFTPKSEQKFTPGPGGLYSTSTLAQHNNATALITTREKSGEAEAHADWEDHIFTQDGE